ncbi:MAG: protein phosphatase 2C domain-containing protein [Polyangiaceae bacterium]|jgi:protein phosphatase
MMATSESDAFEGAVRFATLSDTGTERPHNEDACGAHIESAAHIVIAVADGVSGLEAGEVASRTAVDVTLSAYRDSPSSWGPAKRLYRAAQQANIEIHDRSLVVTELRGMSTTLTAVAVHGATAYAAHVGDSRLYLLRNGRLVQKTKDHTVAADRRRMGLMSAERLKDHPDRCTLTRSLGHDLIAAVDRISFPLATDDVLLICSDGLYNVLSNAEIRDVASSGSCENACAQLIRLANTRGTPDNLTAAIVRVREVTSIDPPTGWRRLLPWWR